MRNTNQDISSLIEADNILYFYSKRSCCYCLLLISWLLYTQMPAINKTNIWNNITFQRKINPTWHQSNVKATQVAYNMVLESPFHRVKSSYWL